MSLALWMVALSVAAADPDAGLDVDAGAPMSAVVDAGALDVDAGPLDGGASPSLGPSSDDGGTSTLDGGDSSDGGVIVHVMDEKEMIDLAQSDRVRLSLPTQEDVQAWTEPGLRVALGYGWADVHGIGPALAFTSNAVILRPSYRVDAYWEAGLTLLYGGGPGGVRWSITAEPELHVWRGLSVAVGLGYGGLSIDDQTRDTGSFSPGSEPVSRTLSDSEKLQSCSGDALSTLARTEYLFVVGPLFSTGPYAQLNAQWTECQDSFGRVDPETGKQVVLTQWWRNQGFQLGWWFTWR
ncbi:MAG: hypothetical protein JST54_17725 [Deltaproteobacteria bacterium]|nr:hypothetical protein [Deltaproteobacteria bacterium]